MSSGIYRACFSLVALFTIGSRAQELERPPNDHPDRFSEFDMKLTRLVAAKEPSNVILSPISVKLVLAMLYEGARGNTSKEIREALDIKDSKALSRNRLTVILQSLQASNEGYDIAVGTKLFLDKTATPKAQFSTRIRNLYNGTIEKIDFHNTSDAVSRINSWAKTVTRGHINQLLSEVDSKENTVLLLVNALFFKGLWENQFPLNQTKEDNFYVDDVTPVRVPFMNAVHSLEYVESGDVNASVVRLPYQGGKFAMYIVLPFERTGLQSLVQELTPEKMRKCVSEMQLVSVQVKLPQFNFEYSANLAPALKELGLSDMFSPEADLSGIAVTDKELVVSNVIQKSALEVNEQGSTAAVVTSVELVSKFGEHIVDFEADHPFILYIEDETTDTVVFIAKVTNPEGSGQPILSANVPSTPKPPAPLPSSTRPNVLTLAEGLNNKLGDSPAVSQEKFSYLDIDLLKEYHDGGVPNWVLSPASIKTALSLLYEGSSGDTMNELAAVMRIPYDENSASNQLRSFQSQLKTTPQAITVRSANRILLKKGLKALPTYSRQIQDSYSGDILATDFSDPSSVTQEVNKWCYDTTKGAIPELITGDALSENSSVVILNAIYFKSGWRMPFDPSLTAKRCFYTARNECIETDMMKTRGVFRVGNVPALNSYVLEIPYQDTRYSMVIVLPDKRQGLRGLAKDLPFNSLMNVLPHLPFSEVILTIPKFTIEYSQSLKNILNKLGVNALFTPKADLSRMLGNNSFTRITDVIHRAKIEVTEAGTTAAAASAAFGETLAQTSAIPFKADHPFFFFILDSTIGFLFEGQYSLPETGNGFINSQPAPDVSRQINNVLPPSSSGPISFSLPVRRTKIDNQNLGQLP